jgi:hypothetical protein
VFELLHHKGAHFFVRRVGIVVLQSGIQHPQRRLDVFAGAKHGFVRRFPIRIADDRTGFFFSNDPPLYSTLPFRWPAG